jgi:hypothetical protein
VSIKECSWPAVTDSIAVLARMVSAVDQFLESQGWPS